VRGAEHVVDEPFRHALERDHPGLHLDQPEPDGLRDPGQRQLAVADAPHHLEPAELLQDARVDRLGLEGVAALLRCQHQPLNAWMPVCARPRISAWMSCVPS
jgi:hypothetical protein